MRVRARPSSSRERTATRVIVYRTAAAFSVPSPTQPAFPSSRTTLGTWRHFGRARSREDEGHDDICFVASIRISSRGAAEASADGAPFRVRKDAYRPHPPALTFRRGGWYPRDESGARGLRSRSRLNGSSAPSPSGLGFGLGAAGEARSSTLALPSLCPPPRRRRPSSLSSSAWRARLSRSCSACASCARLAAASCRSRAARIPSS